MSTYSTTRRVYDGCKIIDKLLFGPPEVMRDIDVQIDRLFLAAVGYHAGCPLLEGRLTATQEIVLPANAMPFNSLPGVRVSRGHLSCLNVDHLSKAYVNKHSSWIGI